MLMRADFMLNLLKDKLVHHGKNYNMYIFSSEFLP